MKAAGAPVQVSDLTNPSYAPGFLAGDSYKYEIYGAPNQPVKYIQNGGPLTQVGQTDAHGYFALTGAVVAQQCGNYTQTWFVGGTQIEQIFAFSVIPTVIPYDVTNPNLTPNFAVGDTYQYTVLGPPNQPVYATNNGNPGAKYYEGQTDATGKLVITEVGIKNWIGSYTQVWSVGSLTASPALSFVVGQFGSTGTVTTTNIGQTSDGHLEGVSMLSITNGVVSTYSATNLDSTASLYYDSDTVATLFDNGTQVKQTVAPINSNTVANMSATATAWDDYDLQTDHYAITYFLSGGYYENPLYWGNSCDTETGDCTVDGGGGFAYWLTVQSIYLGSTLANQTNVPQDGSVPTFSDQSFLKSLASNQTSSGQALSYAARWAAVVLDTTRAIQLAENAFSKAGQNYPLPILLELTNDHPENFNSPPALALRTRTYVLKDSLGHEWTSSDHPAVTIFEKFIKVQGSGGMPTPNNPSSGNSGWNVADKELTTKGFMGDDIGQQIQQPEVDYLQFFWATGLNPPAFGLPPGIPGLGLPPLPNNQSSLQIPLFIRDYKSLCLTGDFSLQLIQLASQVVSVNGDSGPGTRCHN